jgi:hypothetical protein
VDGFANPGNYRAPTKKINFTSWLTLGLYATIGTNTAEQAGTPISSAIQGEVPMYLRTSLLATAGVLLPLLCGAQQAAINKDPPAESKTAGPALQPETASVEEVLATEDDGYYASAYVVRWHGNRVLLVDRLASTHLVVGANVSFTVTRHEVGGRRLLSFVLCRCDDGRQRPKTPAIYKDPTPVSSSADFKTGIVEEVLGAEDGGYRAIGYIVQSKAARLAVADPIAQSNYRIGDSISILAVRTKFKSLSLLAFTAMPALSTSPGVTAAPELTTAPQSGLITEALTSSDANYSYRAYIVEAQGARVVVEDSSDAGPHQVGEQLAFVSRRIENPLTPGHGLLSFGPTAQQEAPSHDPNGTHVSLNTDTATVDEVLTRDLNGDRYVAYIVKWNGTRVGISDVFASTHYAVGDRITFSVTRAGAAGQGHLNFMMFNFVPPAQPPQKAAASG